MANPVDYEQKSADLDTVTLHLVVPIGAAGAPGTATRSHEFLASAPIAHGSTGVYTVTLREQWIAILGWNFNNLQKTYAKTGVCEVQLTTDSVQSAGTFAVLCVDAAGDATDPASGDILYLTIQLQKTAP